MNTDEIEAELTRLRSLRDQLEEQTLISPKIQQEVEPELFETVQRIVDLEAELRCLVK